MILSYLSGKYFQNSVLNEKGVRYLQCVTTIYNYRENNDELEVYPDPYWEDGLVVAASGLLNSNLRDFVGTLVEREEYFLVYVKGRKFSVDFIHEEDGE